jgi:Sulfotransferase family
MSLGIAKRRALPYARAVKYGVLARQALRRARRGHVDGSAINSLRSAFLVGCGRSGTTVVGNILGQLPQVHYFAEPYHLWAAVDPSTDVLNLFNLDDGHLLLDRDACTAEARRRFEILLMKPVLRAGEPVMLEKTPLNAFRLGYLESLSPNARYIHLLRDGTNVARSIELLSEDDSYRIAGKPTLNRWWGCDDSKWIALARDGAKAGYFPDELARLDNFLTRGAYEWLVTQEEVDRWRGALGDRLLEVTYRFACSQPAEALHQIGDFLGVDVPDSCVEYARRLMEELRQKQVPNLILPPHICKRFNWYQERFGFAGRAISA